MQPIKSFFYVILFLTIFLESCSIEKRLYTNGYHLQRKHVVKSESPKEVVADLKPESKVVEIKKNPEEKASLSQNKDARFASSEKNKRILLTPSDSLACDTLILRNETEIKVKIIEITPTEIKYKHCNNLNGPTYVVYRYDVSYIKYANGSLDSFVNEYPPANNGGNVRYNKSNRGSSFPNNSFYSDGFQTERIVANKSTRSLVLGIVAFVVSFLGVFAAIFAIIRGVECLRLINQSRNPEQLYIYRRRAIAGLVLGIIYLSLIVLVFALILLLAAGII